MAISKSRLLQICMVALRKKSFSSMLMAYSYSSHPHPPPRGGRGGGGLTLVNLSYFAILNLIAK
jgi:hypothetical protein